MGFPGQEHHHLPIGPTVVAGGHVELDEEVTSLLTPPSPCPETRDLCLGLSWVWAEGGAHKGLGGVRHQRLGPVLSHSQLLDGGLRELWEESGLQLPQGQFSWVPLGLWEVRQEPGKGPFLI